MPPESEILVGAGETPCLLERMPGTAGLGTSRLFYFAQTPKTLEVMTEQVRFGFAHLDPKGRARGSTSHEHLFIAGLEGRPHFFDLSMHSLRSAVGLPELKKRSPSVGNEKASEIPPAIAQLREFGEELIF
jgi:hypothetical protein